MKQWPFYQSPLFNLDNEPTGNQIERTSGMILVKDSTATPALPPHCLPAPLKERSAGYPAGVPAGFYILDVNV